MMNWELSKLKGPSNHECQCQEHDCTNHVVCIQPALCSKMKMYHICPACWNCSDTWIQKEQEVKKINASNDLSRNLEDTK